MPVFYPSCVAHIQVKFDETLHVNPDPPVPTTLSNQLEGQAELTTQQLQPLVIQPGEQNVSFIMNRVPRAAHVENPGYRQAGQFSIEMDYRELPIDPRTVQAATIEIHIGAVNALDFATGVTTVESNGTRRSVLRTRDSAGNPNQSTMAIIGIVDEWTVSHSSTESKVSMRGRDMRGVLLDFPINVVPSAAQTLLDSLDLSQDIAGVVVQILRFNPLFSQFTVDVNPQEWPNGVVPIVGATSAVPRHQLNARGTRSSARASGGGGDSNNLNFWDLIVRMCYLVGAIPYFEGTRLLIRPSRAIFDQARAGIDPRIPTPFFNGGLRNVDAQTGAQLTPPLSFRRMVYGRDLEELEFGRKFAGYQKPRVIRCISQDTERGQRGLEQVVEARWPPAAAPTGRGTRATRTTANNSSSQEEILNVPVPGVRDVARLQEIAKAVFEEIGRGEITGSCSTLNLASFGGDNDDPDLCRLMPGDGIEFVTDVRGSTGMNPLVSPVTNMQRAPFDQQVSELQQTIGDANLARVIVATTRGLLYEVQRFFRVANVKKDWSAEKGLKIAFDFQNYVVPRFQVGEISTAPGAVESTAVPATRTTPRAARTARRRGAA